MKTDFLIFNDSSCYLREISSDYWFYSLYEGHLSKKDNSFLEFEYRPIVNFGLCERFDSGDSITFHVNQEDTIIQQLKYKIHTTKGKETEIKIMDEFTTIFLRDISHMAFFINTNFLDPISKKSVLVTVLSDSAPELTYYGRKTGLTTTKIQITKNKLKLFADGQYIFDPLTLMKE